MNAAEQASLYKSEPQTFESNVADSPPLAAVSDSGSLAVTAEYSRPPFNLDGAAASMQALGAGEPAAEQVIALAHPTSLSARRPVAKGLRDDSIYDDPSFDLSRLPKPGPERDIAVAAMDYILGRREELDISFDILSDFGAVFAGAQHAMYCDEYLANPLASLKLQRVMHEVTLATQKQNPKPKRALGSKKGTSVPNTPSAAYLKYLGGPTLTYILQEDAPPHNPAAQGSANQVLRALVGTDWLDDEAVLARFIEVQQQAAEAPGIHKYDYRTAGRLRNAIPKVRPTWAAEAACAGLGAVDRFFPEDAASVSELQVICEGCRHQDDCLELALINREEFGVWGGMSQRSLRNLRLMIRNQSTPISKIRRKIGKIRGQEPAEKVVDGMVARVRAGWSTLSAAENDEKTAVSEEFAS